MESELKTISISSNESLISIEEKIKKISSGQRFKLRIPSSLNTRGALGVEVAIIQLIGTWLRRSGYKKILHTHQISTPKDFRQLCTSIYGIAGLSLVDEVWDKKKARVPRSMALAEAKITIERLRNKQITDSFTSRYFGIPCIKTPTYDRENEMPVYNLSTGEVIKSGAFHSLFENVLMSVVGVKNRLIRLNKKVGIEELSEMLWELFKNTHDHGRKDIDENEWPTNFRGLIVQQQDLTNEYLDVWCGKNPSKTQEAFREKCCSNTKKNHIVDISIVDLGAGLIDLARSKSAKIDECEILLWCLANGNSRLSGSSRGDGFTKVLKKVAEHNGWIRIRTAKLLFEKTYDSSFADVISRADIQVLTHEAAGTSIHISIPLNVTAETVGE